VILGIGVARRAAALLRHPQDAEGAPARTSLLGRAHTLWAAHVGVPALVHAHQAAGGWGFLSLPTRLEALLIFIYVALNFIWSCTNYELFDDNLFWPGDRRTQLARYIADRTGIMSFYNLPLLWVLAGRNDVLLWLTGWSYASASLFHRWVARVATLQAIVHSAAYTWLEKDELAASFKERYWATGVFATVTMALLLPLSIRPLREKAYEASSTSRSRSPPSSSCSTTSTSSAQTTTGTCGRASRCGPSTGRSASRASRSSRAAPTLSSRTAPSCA
jgi:hypothetical protein